MARGDNGCMNQTTPDNRPEPNEADPVDVQPVMPNDPLNRIQDELDELPDLDPAEAVDVLAEITAALNRELDADADRS